MLLECEKLNNCVVQVGEVPNGSLVINILRLQCCLFNKLIFKDKISKIQKLSYVAILNEKNMIMVKTIY